MNDVTLRPARSGDRRIIRQMVHTSHLDPFYLRWQHFIVAERTGEIVGIGQIRPYRNCPELGSLVVSEPHRRKGIGKRIVRVLLADAARPVYLECAGRTKGYYEQFGFQEIPWDMAPHPLRFKAWMARLVGARVVVMRWNKP